MLSKSIWLGASRASFPPSPFLLLCSLPSFPNCQSPVPVGFRFPSDGWYWYSGVLSGNSDHHEVHTTQLTDFFLMVASASLAGVLSFPPLWVIPTIHWIGKHYTTREKLRKPLKSFILFLQASVQAWPWTSYMTLAKGPNFSVTHIVFSFSHW